jgi:hypothetical protein
MVVLRQEKQISGEFTGNCLRETLNGERPYKDDLFKLLRDINIMEFPIQQYLWLE